MKIKTIFLLAAAVMFTLPCFAQENDTKDISLNGTPESQGKPKNILNEDVFYFDFSRSNPDVVYAVAGSTIQKTTDAGRNWTKISSLTKIVSLVVDDTNPDIVYAATGG
ncbi:WD40/YVTN/BNR-like repeat-containing protein [candidate division KSB1 bacterium]